MLKYIARRILIFIPTLIVISLVTFIISVNAPGDPVETILDKKQGESNLAKGITDQAAYINLRHKLGLDLPRFYFSFTNATTCDTLYKIPRADVRDNLEHLSYVYGDWNLVSDYYKSVVHLNEMVAGSINDSACRAKYALLRPIAEKLYTTWQEDEIASLFVKMNAVMPKACNVSEVTGYLNNAKEAFQKVVTNKNGWRKYIPKFHWYGFRNQYHHWLVGFLHSDFGVSYQDMRPVRPIIWDAMKWTMGISFLSILLAYFIAVPLGVGAAVRKGSRGERITTTGLFMLYSLPNFWIATLLIIFFCGGDWFSWFPAPGAAPIPSDAPLMYHITQGLYRLILPLICWTYTSLAFISRQMRGGMLNVIGQDYIRTARAKGLPEKQVIWKHALRNSLLPVITLFANIFPLVISGSVVVEQIFSIPGMGQISYNALVANDFPVVFTDVMFAAMLTLVGTLVADILYAVVDPRISFTKQTA